MTKSQQKAYDWAFGLHSNIPSCCIEFYVDNWDRIWNREDEPYQQAVDAARFGYVPCPQCLGYNRRAKIVNCEFECGGDHRSDFVPKEALNDYRSGTHKQLHPSDGV